MTTDPNNNMHPDTIQLDPEDGQPYIAELKDRLFETIASAQTKDEVEERLRELYPESKLVDTAIREANKKLRGDHRARNHSSSSSSASFTGALHNLTSFAVSRVNWVREGVIGNRSESDLVKFKKEFVQYIIDDVTHLASDFVTRLGNCIITRSDIRTAMHAEEDLMDMFLSDDKSLSIMEHHPILARIEKLINNIDKPMHSNGRVRSLLTYKQKVRFMVDSENTFIRELELIIKVFKAQLEKIDTIKREVQILFCNIEEILELSTLLLSVLEDALESVGQDEVPYVGSEILDIAQAEEFHAYYNFAHKRLSKHWYSAYLSIVAKIISIVASDEATVDLINDVGPSFDRAVRHLLPIYLLNTIEQFFEYYKNFSDLHELSQQHDNLDDELSLSQTISIMTKTKKAIKDLLEEEREHLVEMEPIDPKEAENIRKGLEKHLNAQLQHERSLPLPYMPPPEIYRFSEPDTKDNIQFDHSKNNGTDQIPVISAAKLFKLVERLTYHRYQPNIVDSFLITYRSFIDEPEELLDLLIERFKIPNPPLSIVFPDFRGVPEELPESDRIAYKLKIKRFRQDYSKPVKMRVINVLKSWIKNHYYDFESHPQLLGKLELFLEEVYEKEKVLRNLIVSIQKSIDQKKRGQDEDFEFMLSETPPPIEWLQVKSNEPDKFDILTLHPTEFARQLTLFEFDLFRAIKPLDLGMGFRKDKDKDRSSPNLSRLRRHFTLLSYWIRKIIVETEDFDKRKAVYNRAVEIMAQLKLLNNYTGLLSIGSAMLSAPIKRLSHTNSLPNTLHKVLTDYEILSGSRQKEIEKELRRCNPPCIPYTGVYETKLIHAKEGNRTFMNGDNSSTFSNDESPATPISPATIAANSGLILNTIPTTPRNHSIHSPSYFGDLQTPNTPYPPHSATSINQRFFSCSTEKMVNFSKHRMLGDLVAELRNYQNQPYCLEVQPEIKKYIESIETLMYNFALSLDPQAKNSDYWAEPELTSLSQRLDQYLFEQSKRIEPKNSNK